MTFFLHSNKHSLIIINHMSYLYNVIKIIMCILIESTFLYSFFYYKNLYIKIMDKRDEWFIEKYKNMTIEQLKNLTYNGQGQLQSNNKLWDLHV